MEVVYISPGLLMTQLVMALAMRLSMSSQSLVFVPYAATQFLGPNLSFPPAQSHNDDCDEGPLSSSVHERSSLSLISLE